MTDDLNISIQKLISLKVGDHGRLNHITDTLEKGKPLYSSDRRYVESLISKYIKNSQTNHGKPASQDTNESEMQVKNLTNIENLEAENHNNTKTSNVECPSKGRFLFQTPPSKNLVDVGLLVVRLGIAFGFIWAGMGKVSDPAGFGQMLQSMTGIDPLMATSMATIIGTLELISGTLVLIGVLTRLAAAFQIVILIGAVMMFGFDFTAGPAIWKDPALLGIAILLMLYGSGKFGLDYIIAKKLVNLLQQLRSYCLQ